MSEPGLDRRPTSLPRLGVVGLVVLVYFLLIVSAASGTPRLFAALITAAVAVDLYAELRQPGLRALLRGAQLTLPVRGVFATMALALLMTRTFPSWSDRHLILVVALAMSMPLCRSIYLGVLSFHNNRTSRTLFARNLDLPDLAEPDPLPTLLTARVDRWLVLLGSGVLVLSAVFVAFGREWPFSVLALAYDVVVLAATAYLARRVLQLLRLPDSRVREQRMLARMRELDAQVVLYFSGAADSAYQINMWLPTLEALPYRIVVLLRERPVFDTLAATTLPVLCMPSGVSVMQAGLSRARVALYPANTSKNLHMLREPAVRHVFIGHGDSDKVSSVNPFTRVYDQVWVAGRAGRDRWARAGVGVRDEQVVEVGRPQLDSVEPGRVGAGQLTVLYAPTWEGWTDETFFSSITGMGPALVAALLELPGVRVIYKPHPFTGMRDPRAGQASERIVAMLAAANGAGPDQPSAAVAPAPPVQGRGEDVTAFRERARRWAADWWAELPPTRHVVVGTPGPDLYDCFNHADLLVADVSSVVSDFLASGKPYVCANPQRLPEEEFRARNPTAGAAYVLGPDQLDPASLAAIVEDARGADSFGAARAQLREYLLGPPRPTSLQRWQTALGALVDQPEPRASAPAVDDESVGEEVGELAPDRDAVDADVASDDVRG